MNLLGAENLSSCTSASSEEDFLIRKVLLTQDPDGSQLDSKILLRAVENIVLHATPISVVSDPEISATNVCIAEAIGFQESLGYIFKISHEILHRCYEDEDIHTNTMSYLKCFGILDGMQKWF